MSAKLSWLRRALLALAMGLAMQSAAQAHLMVAQHGTLNFVGDGAFMVLSLPVSAFNAVDDDGDGQLSMAEFGAHRAAIGATVIREVKLLDEQGARPLEGIMLSLSPQDSTPSGPATQLVVMGRFALAPANNSLRFQVGLFGQAASEQTMRVTVTRPSQEQSHLLVLTPERSAGALFPSAWSIFADYAVLGVEHIVTGLDHLVFLLVVLAAGWGWRHVLLALSAFTFGHTITLMISILGGLSIPSVVVESAIAATIIGMAVFDMYARQRARLRSLWLRLGLVFGCALIHGLGLSSALIEFGLDRQHQLVSLAGFNIGIELGQLLVALLAMAAMACVKRVRGAGSVGLITRMASFSAISIGSFWLVQRMFSSA
ncbi:MAG: HupE/UreJ family protein [Burkholderiaceae bacterium]